MRLARVLTALLSALAISASAALAADAEIVRVWPQWRAANSFERISEYFGGQENDGRQIIVRSHPDQREGLYLLVRLKTGTAIPGANFQLAIIRPDSPDPKTFTFSANIPANHAVVLLGLTGTDWPGGRETHPVAWHLTVTDAAGNTRAEEKSFLWEKPAK